MNSQKKQIKECITFVVIITFIVLSLLMNFSFFRTIKAEELGVEKNNFKYVSSENAKILVKNATEKIYKQTVEISEVEPIYNIDDTFFGWQIRFETQNYSDTMIIMDTNISKLLIYSFTLCTEKSELSDVERKSFGADRKYLVNFLDTATQISNDILETENSLKINKIDISFNINDYLPKAFMPNLDDDFVRDAYQKFDTNWFNTHVYLVNSHDITGSETFVPATTGALNSAQNVGNCGPTAAYNILKYYSECKSFSEIFKKSNGDPKTQGDVYKELVEDMTKEDGTTIYEMSGGIDKYIKNRTPYKCSYTHYAPPNWGYFKGDLDNNYPILYTVAGSNNEYHALAVMGYTEIKEDKWWFPKRFNFLKVASGWTNDIRYTNFDAVSWKLGCVVKITK